MVYKMKNSITAKISFSFKGKEHHPSAIIDLDDAMANSRDLSNLPLIIAKENNIGLYSYELEVMESTPPEFENATGMATECLENGSFDFQKFKQLWSEEKNLTILSEIAKKRMGIEDLNKHPELKIALLDAFNAGRK